MKNFTFKQLNYKSLFLITSFLTLSFSASATLVVPALEKRQLGQSFQITGSFKSAKTTVERINYSANFNWNYGRESDQFMAFGSMDYGDVDDKKYIDKHLIHARYIRYEIMGDLRSEFFVQQERNELAALADRSLIGAGLSMLFGENDDNFTYHLMGGVMRESEEHNSDPTLDRTNTRLTISNQLKWKIFEKNNFTFTNYIQPKISDFDNYRLIIDGTLSVPLSESLSIGLGANFRRYSDAYEGIPKDTHAVNTSITYKF